MLQHTVERAAAALAGGGLAIIIREDQHPAEADLVAAAGLVTDRTIAFMCNHARGLTELALSAARVAALRLPPMSPAWDAPRKPFTVSIEARRGVGTGISARDRALTIRVAVSEETRPEDLICPGHVFPLRAHAGGLQAGPGRTEAALALVDLAGCGEGAVLCQILDDTGELAGRATLDHLCRQFGLTRVSQAAIVDHLALNASGTGRQPDPTGAHFSAEAPSCR